MLLIQDTTDVSLNGHKKKLPKQMRDGIDKKLLLLAKDPGHPSLRTKRIQGTDKLFESSVNMDVRLIWHYDGDFIIILLDVGHHDILKRF